MKLTCLIALILIYSCQTKNEISVFGKKVVRGTEPKKFFVGDIDNDKIEDTAFVKENNNLEVRISFSNNIPEINLESSSVVVQKTADLNDDKANEIMIFSKTHEGWWNYISILTLKNHKWEEIAKVKAFIADDEDFENRIIKENGNYYLVGEDQWNEDENGEFLKTKVKI